MCLPHDTGKLSSVDDRHYEGCVNEVSLKTTDTMSGERPPGDTGTLMDNRSKNRCIHHVAQVSLPLRTTDARTGVSMGLRKGMMRVVLVPVPVKTLTGSCGCGSSPVPDATNTHSPSCWTVIHSN